MRGVEERGVLKTSELERQSVLGFYNVRLTLPSSSAVLTMSYLVLNLYYL